MHYAVWVITSRTETQLAEARARDETEEFLEGLREEATRISAHLYEEEIEKGEDEPNPPLTFDWKQTGGRWDGTIDPGDVLANHALCRDAAENSNENLPKAVVTPEGRYAFVSDFEEKPELRRLLRHWPDNVVLSEGLAQLNRSHRRAVVQVSLTADRDDILAAILARENQQEGE